MAKIQKFTSSATSINKTKLPAIYKKVKIGAGDQVLDFGCGKYTDHLQKFVKSQGGDLLCFDPYNQEKFQNLENLIKAQEKLDIVLISNVFNVIAEVEIITSIVEKIHSNLKPEKGICITVYEGNKTGIGKQSQKDSWQRNQPIKWYLELFTNLGYTCNLKNSVITIF